MYKIKTARDAAALAARYELTPRERNAALIKMVLNRNPGIGILIRKGKPVYYVSFPVYAEAADPAKLVAEVL